MNTTYIHTYIHTYMHTAKGVEDVKVAAVVGGSECHSYAAVMVVVVVVVVIEEGTGKEGEEE